MLLVQDPLDFRLIPRSVDAAGRVTINDRRFAKSFAMSSDRLIEEWRPRRVEEIELADLDVLLSLQPTVILLGTGTRHAFPSQAVLAFTLGLGVGLEPMDNAAAARTFAVLASEGRRVVVAFLIDAT